MIGFSIVVSGKGSVPGEEIYRRFDAVSLYTEYYLNILSNSFRNRTRLLEIAMISYNHKLENPESAHSAAGPDKRAPLRYWRGELFAKLAARQ